MLLATFVFAAGTVLADPQCNSDFIGFQPAEKLKYDKKGDRVQAQAKPNEKAVCFDLESRSTDHRKRYNPEIHDDDFGEDTTCEICVGTPGHLTCKDGIANLMENRSRVMDCVEDVEELNIADVWVKMGPECTDALWIDAILVWADKWTCTNPSAATNYKHNGKTFRATDPGVEKTSVAYGKSNNYGWCLSNNPSDALMWRKGRSRYNSQKVLGETCYPVLRFTIDGGQPKVQGYASADLLEAAEAQAIKALWQGKLPGGIRRRAEIKESAEYINLQRQFRRRAADEANPADALPVKAGEVEISTEAE